MRLHYTLGPVQTFVAQARKTQDFWAGSFLLSWLAGQAIYAVHTHGGKLILPSVVDDQNRLIDDLVNAIDSAKHGKIWPNELHMASLPNRFAADVPEDFDPALCTQAVEETWEKLSQIIWERYVRPIASIGKDTEAIWRRQVGHFWEQKWVISDLFTDLDRRKSWRTHIVPPEPGGKCTLMGSFQELSGHTRGVLQKSFWDLLARQVEGYLIRENEQLCAVAFIKRVLPLVADEVIGRVPQQYPSTRFLAAIPWLQSLPHTPEVHRDIASYVELVQSSCSGYRGDEAKSIPVLTKELSSASPVRTLATLKSDFFDRSSFEDKEFLEQHKICNQRQLLQALDRVTGHKQVGVPGRFYAMLLMDGDRMGDHLKKQEPRFISAALRRFNSVAEKIVAGFCGVTVYCGGDDLLALVPLDSALNAAEDVKKAFGTCFMEVDLALRPSISAAIIYAHEATPLKAVYGKIQQLLDEVAKNTIGRDAVAVAVWKGSGVALEWSLPWQKLYYGQEHVVDILVQEYQKQVFNSSFIYNIQQRYIKSGNFKIMEDGFWKKVLVAEYQKNAERKLPIDQVEALIDRLTHACTCFRRDENGAIRIIPDKFSIEGLKYIKFLAEKGVE
ncbi:MAG: Crm2 family CRISPR-associated protein [Bacillota bacterium]|nr:MAG: Crm2 family CRISPR-associated protein [Bacillota bacterium]